MSKIVLLDIDSTLNNFQEYFLSVFKVRYPEYKDKELTTHFDAFRLDKEKSMVILTEDGFTESLSPLEGAVNAVEEIDKKGYTIFFCTALVTDTSNAMRDRVQWIGKWFGEKWMKRVIFTQDKTLVRGDFLIDDSPFKSKGLMDPIWKLIVFDVSYNRDDKCYGRIFNWNDLDRLFSILES